MERLLPDVATQFPPRCKRLKASEPAMADVGDSDIPPATAKATTILQMRLFFM
jgi:hypothetical protein